MQFFISDTHFFHQDLLGENDFAPRLFKDVSEMDEALLNAWNARVDDNDIVYHLGDIAMNPEHFPKVEETFDLLRQLHGRIVFVKGNHDYAAHFKYFKAHDPLLEGASKFAFHDVGTIIKDDHTQLFLTHYPLMMGIVHQSLNLHGHIHHSMVPIAENLNVGVDAPERALLEEPLPWGSPLSAKEIHALYEAKKRLLEKRD